MFNICVFFVRRIEEYVTQANIFTTDSTDWGLNPYTAQWKKKTKTANVQLFIHIKFLTIWYVNFVYTLFIYSELLGTLQFHTSNTEARLYIMVYFIYPFLYSVLTYFATFNPALPLISVVLC